MDPWSRPRQFSPPAPNVVDRTRLIERLDEGLSERSKLSLISAHADLIVIGEWYYPCTTTATTLANLNLAFERGAAIHILAPLPYLINL